MKQLRMICGSAILALAAMAPASASPICANTLDCTLELTQANSSSGFGTGNFGTVHLVDNGTNQVTITVSVNSGWDIIDTGFPGSFGFSDSLGGGLAIGNFSSGLYSGALSDATQDLHFDGFGYSQDAAATTGPHNGSGLQTVSFTVTKAGLSDVNFLLNPSFHGGDGSMYFVVDAGQTGPNGSTGLLGVTDPSSPVPEPISLSLVGGGLLAVGLFRKRSSVQ
jgi:hypothetical protein